MLNFCAHLIVFILQASSLFFSYCKKGNSGGSKGVLSFLFHMFTFLVYYFSLNEFFCSPFSLSCFFFTMFCCWSPVDPPNITYMSGNQTVNQTDFVTLNCSADGNPAPRITWTRVSDNSAVTFPLTITGKGNEGAYTCTADNGVKDSFSKDTFIIVQSKSKAF